MKHLGVYFPGKKANYLFFASNQDNDTTMDVNEFIDMWLNEQERKDKRRRLLTEYYIKIQNRGRGICGLLANLFRPTQASIETK